MIEPDARHRAVWGEPPPDRPHLQPLDFRPMRKGKLLGFAKIELPNGIRISDIPVSTGRQGAFATMPRRPILGSDGRQKPDSNARPQDVPFLERRNRDLSGRFADALVALVLKAHSGAVKGGPGAGG
jgi:hypothetical protein